MASAPVGLVEEGRRFQEGREDLRNSTQTLRNPGDVGFVGLGEVATLSLSVDVNVSVNQCQ